jgi:hypothetical protein
MKTQIVLLFWMLIYLMHPCNAEENKVKFTEFAVLYARLTKLEHAEKAPPKDDDLMRYLNSKGFDLSDLITVSVGAVGESSIFVVANQNRIFYGYPCEKLISLLASYDKDGFRMENMVLHRLTTKKGFSIQWDATADQTRSQNSNSQPVHGKGFSFGRSESFKNTFVTPFFIAPEFRPPRIDTSHAD